MRLKDLGVCGSDPGNKKRPQKLRGRFLRNLANSLSVELIFEISNGILDKH